MSLDIVKDNENHQKNLHEYLMSLDIVKDNENHNFFLHEYERLIQKKGRVLEITEQFLQTRESTCMC